MIIVDFFKGILMGIANVIPGLSGATIAVVLGVYERVINFFSRLFSEPFNALKDEWAIMLGMATGIVLSLFGITYLVEKFPVPTLMFIVGLITGAIPKVYNQVDEKKVHAVDIIFFVLMIAIIVGLPLIQSENTLTIDFDIKIVTILVFLGAISAGTMIIPGVSGSMVLLALGYYIFILTKVELVVTSFFKFEWTVFFANLLILLPFIIGIILGLVLVSKLIKYLLSKYFQIVTYAILGLLVASPFAVIYSMVNDPEIGPTIEKAMVSSWIIGGVMLILGAFTATYMSKIDEKINNKG